MHGGEEKNEGRDSGELVRMEKRKFAGDNVLGGGQASGETEEVRPFTFIYT